MTALHHILACRCGRIIEMCDCPHTDKALVTSIEPCEVCKKSAAQHAQPATLQLGRDLHLYRARIVGTSIGWRFVLARDTEELRNILCDELFYPSDRRGGLMVEYLDYSEAFFLNGFILPNACDEEHATTKVI